MEDRQEDMQKDWREAEHSGATQASLLHILVAELVVGLLVGPSQQQVVKMENLPNSVPKLSGEHG